MGRPDDKLSEIRECPANAVTPLSGSTRATAAGTNSPQPWEPSCCVIALRALFAKDLNRRSLLRSVGAFSSTIRRGCTIFRAEHYCGQMYPAPVGLLKQPTDSGITCFGSHSTTFGKKIVNVMVNRKTT